jgi:[lysine-biosynthesis-protein LysW]---L-2-aminoadipate ligase
VFSIIGRASLTNARLAAALTRTGHEARVLSARELTVQPGDTVLGRLDVRPTLDGVEDGLWRLQAVAEAGARVLNRPAALLTAHDKLATAVALGRAGLPQPRTAHVRDALSSLSFGPPYVLKPRFGSWGRDVVIAGTPSELESRLRELRRRRWFRRQGALVQELVRPTGVDLRIVVSGGGVIGAVERLAPPGEWRTNVSLGARRLPACPTSEARELAIRAVDAVGLDLAGVDLVERADRSLVVLEANGAVDFTTEYGLDGEDPFALAVASLSCASLDEVVALPA